MTIVDTKPFAGSNAWALSRYLLTNIPTLDVEVIQGSATGFLELMRRLVRMAQSGTLLFTHNVTRFSKKQLCVQMWHGIPIKGMGFMDRGLTDYSKVSTYANRADLLVSSSDMVDVLISACFGISKKKFVRAGFPRNDLLVTPDSHLRHHLASEFSSGVMGDNTRIIFYIPTFRVGHKGQYNEGAIDIWCDWQLNELEDFLRINDAVLLMKPHPYEMRRESVGRFFQSEYVKVIDDIWLSHNRVDLYSLLALTDTLITDYSSVFFDFLLCDRPILFFVPDIEEYQRSRGFLLSPFHQWAPGLVVFEAEQLLVGIHASFQSPNEFKEDRRRIRDLFFEAGTDAQFGEWKSCDRLWKKINQAQKAHLS